MAFKLPRQGPWGQGLRALCNFTVFQDISSTGTQQIQITSENSQKWPDRKEARSPEYYLHDFVTTQCKVNRNEGLRWTPETANCARAHRHAYTHTLHPAVLLAQPPHSLLREGDAFECSWPSVIQMEQLKKLNTVLSEESGVLTKTKGTERKAFVLLSGPAQPAGQPHRHRRLQSQHTDLQSEPLAGGFPAPLPTSPAWPPAFPLLPWSAGCGPLSVAPQICE